MTTAIIHGDPGSRKTATMIAEYGIPALFEGRTVVSNIRGFNDTKKIEEVYGKKLPEGAKLIAVPFTREGFRRMGTFFHWAPPGAMILMDEGQRVYPTRMRSLDMFDCSPPRASGFVDKATGVEEDISSVEEAFDCHRHMNWDIYISTPNIGKVHKEIRQVAEFGYRQKDWESISKVLSFVLGDIKRVKHHAENSGIGVSAAITTSNHRIPKKTFACYQSTATGVAKGTASKGGIFTQPKLIIMGICMLYGVWTVAGNYIEHGGFMPARGVPADTASEDSRGSVSNDRHSVAVRNGSNSGAAVSGGTEFFGNGTQGPGLDLFDSIHSYDGFVGRSANATLYQFTLKRGDRYVHINSDDLRGMGFSFYPRGRFVLVQYAGYAKAVYSSPRQHETENQQARSAPDLGPNPFKGNGG